MKLDYRRLITLCLLASAFLFLCGIDSCEKKYTISGTVTGAVREGVTLTLLGDSLATATTAADGSYLFDELFNGTYKIKLSKSGYSFSPKNRDVTISSDNKTGIDFTVAAAEELNTLASINSNMVPVSGGTLQMGCSDGDLNCNEDEFPQHAVTLSPFEIGRYEVTQGQWELLMGENPAIILYECGMGTDYPAYAVSRDNILIFIDELNSQTDKGYRLCTEAEWEYAARAGTSTQWYCGDNESCVYDMAWYKDNSGRTTHPVGMNDPNNWGLYDMSGNVSEWVADWYDEDYYDISPLTDPQGPLSAEINGVNRGGNWGASVKTIRSSCRYQSWSGNSNAGVGFRLCRDE